MDRALGLLMSGWLLTACANGKVDALNGTTGSDTATTDAGDDSTGGDDGTGDAGSGTGDDGGTSEDGGTGDDGGAGEDGTGSGAGEDGGSDGGEGDGDPDPVAVDTRSPGSAGFATTTDTIAVGSDCDMDLTILTPDVAPVGSVVVSHGFIRSGSAVVGWGEHFASHGFLVVVPELCHSSIRDTDHAANGAELAQLPGLLGLGPTAYVGHSAGGLASALALADDTAALGGVGLDPVDSGDLGRDAIGGAPFHGLFGVGGACNSNNNGVDMVSGTALLVTEAGHCDFESPKDRICDIACGVNNPTFSDDDLQETIRALTTAALLGMIGDTTTADAWWAPGGSYYDSLLSAGALSEL